MVRKNRINRWNFWRNSTPNTLNREVLLKMLERYQTIYAKEEGAVAAPTAGFTLF